MNKMKTLKLHAGVLLIWFMISLSTTISDIFIIGRIFRSIFMTNIMNKYQLEMFLLLLRHCILMFFSKDSSNQSSFIAV